MNPRKENKKKYLLEFILPSESKPCHQGACSTIHLVKGLQTEVKPLLSAPLLARRGPGLSRFSPREPAGRPRGAGRAALSLPSGQCVLGRSPARGRKPSAPGGKPGRRGLLGDRSEARHQCPASAAGGLVLLPGLC